MSTILTAIHRVMLNDGVETGEIVLNRAMLNRLADGAGSIPLAGPAGSLTISIDDELPAGVVVVVLRP